jgi:hypothetical protein
MVKPWLVGVVEPVLGTECSWFLVRDLPEHGVLVGSSQVAAGLAELLVVEQPAAERSIRDRLFVACMTFSLSSCQDIRSHCAEHNAVAVTHTIGAISVDLRALGQGFLQRLASGHHRGKRVLLDEVLPLQLGPKLRRDCRLH